MSEDADPQLSKLYRASAREEPPAWLDARVVAAAAEGRKRVAAPVGRPPASRWGLPLALAAVVTLSVSLVLIMRDEPGMLPPAAEAPSGTERLSRPGSPSDTPGAPPAAVAHAPTLPAPASQPAAEARRQVEQDARRRADDRMKSVEPEVDVRPARTEAERSVGALEPLAKNAMSTPAPAQTPSSPTPVPAQAPVAAKAGVPAAVSAAAPKAEAVRESSGVRSLEQSERHQAVAPARERSVAAMTPPEEKRPVADARPDASSDPEQWLRWITRMRQEGRDAEARAGLEEFRKRFPSHPVPEALLK